VEAELDLAETMAKWIVSAVFGVYLKPRDVHTHEGLHDFDIVFVDGAVPLEVKTATNPDLRRLYAGLLRHGMKLPAAGTYEWQVSLRPNADVRRLVKEQRQLALGLRALEVGVGDFVMYRRQGDTRQALGDLFPEIDEAWGWAHPQGPAKVHLLPPGGGGAVGPSAINPFVTAFLSRIAERDGLAKLMRPGTDRRHVFIWLESTLLVEWMSFCENQLPPDKPNLPEQVTDVWLAGYCRGNEIQAWYLPANEGWRSVSGAF
jgi:hypothetical protein